ncbi:MAG: CHAT domain-containing tetratricopeptide repeat protein [Acidobacteriota bacterium]
MPRSAHHMHHAVSLSMLMLILLSFTAGMRPYLAYTQPTSTDVVLLTQTAEEISELLDSKAIERPIKDGERHLYRINLEAGQFLQLSIDKKNFDIVALMFAPNGEKIFEISNRSQELTVVMIVAETMGEYRLEIRAMEKAVQGSYQIKSVEMHVATAQERDRFTAQLLSAEGERLYNQGTVESKQQAIKKYELALLHWRAALDQRSESRILNNLATIYSDIGDRRKALEYHLQALPLRRASGDRRGEAITLNNIGLGYRSLGENEQALVYLKLSLDIRRELNDRQGEAIILNNIALVYTTLGEPHKALEYLNQSLPLRRAVNDRAGEATTLSNIGAVYKMIGEFRQALDYHQQALHLYQEAGDRKGEALTLNNIGLTYSELGETQKALEYYTKALNLRHVMGDLRGAAIILNSIGNTNKVLGETQKALEFLNQSLALSRKIADRPGEATTLNSIGLLYESLGEIEQALDYFNQSLNLQHTMQDQRREAILLNNIGQLYVNMGEPGQALEYINRSLVLRRKASDRSGEATSLNSLGVVYRLQGENQKALDYLNQSLNLRREIGDRLGQAFSLSDIALTMAQRNEKEQALEQFQQALVLYREMGVRQDEALTLYNIARLEREQGRLKESRQYLEAALAITEELRVKVDVEELRASYFTTVRDYYELYIDLLMRLHKQNPNQGYAARALQVSEQARARVLLDILTQAQTKIREGIDPALIERAHTLQEKLNARAEYQLRLLAGKYTKEQAQALERELRDLTTQYQQLQAQINQQNPRYAALTQPQPLSLKEIQEKVLDADTLLLEYTLGSERSYLWLVSHNTLASYELPGRSEIEATARRVYGLFSAGNQRVIDEANQRNRRSVQTANLSATTAPVVDAMATLSRMLLGPVAGQLEKKRLLIVSEDILQFIPFGALPIPTTVGDISEQPLIVNHEIVSLPSVSTLAVLRQELAGRRPAPKMLAVVADPVFSIDDKRFKLRSGKVKSSTINRPAVTTSETEELNLPKDLVRSANEVGLFKQSLHIPRLLHTRQEAERILALAPTAATKRALDFTANRATATSTDLSQYQIVHFATHGLFNSTHPELSGLMLSMVDEEGKAQNGFLRAHDIYNLNLPAELVVLSACQTGLGKQIKGEGLIGLTRGFMYAGSARVLVSLWNVNDKATAELMARFYENMLKVKMRPAAALRAAQVSMWREKRWQSPYYWAGFVLQGEIY